MMSKTDAAEFKEYINLMHVLLESAMNIVRKQGGMTLSRAELYWYPAMKGMLDPTAPQSTIFPMYSALQELIDDAERIDCNTPLL